MCLQHTCTRAWEDVASCTKIGEFWTIGKVVNTKGFILFKESSMDGDNRFPVSENIVRTMLYTFLLSYCLRLQENMVKI